MMKLWPFGKEKKEEAKIVDVRSAPKPKDKPAKNQATIVDPVNIIDQVELN